MKKTVYVDLDNTLADYLGMCDEMHLSTDEAKNTVGFFRKLKPMPGALMLICYDTVSTADFL